jgi:hypothetical protein
VFTVVGAELQLVVGTQFVTGCGLVPPVGSIDAELVRAPVVVAVALTSNLTVLELAAVPTGNATLVVTVQTKVAAPGAEVGAQVTLDTPVLALTLLTVKPAGTASLMVSTVPAGIAALPAAPEINVLELPMPIV